MFFVVSKLFWMVAQPVILSVMVAASGLLIAPRYPRLGRKLGFAGLALLLLLSVSPLPNILIYPLEQRFAGAAKPQSGVVVAGIIMLGGFEDAALSTERGTLEVNDAAERLLDGLLLARQFPDAKVIFTGGSDLPTELGGAQAVGSYLASSGIAPGRIIIEELSQTTYENALFLRQALQPKTGERYVLVTSAFHMPRAMGVFRAQGFDVTPYPVDYRTGGIASFWTPYKIPAVGLRNADYAIKEWIGLLAYRMTGRTKELWPGP